MRVVKLLEQGLTDVKTYNMKGNLPKGHLNSIIIGFKIPTVYAGQLLPNALGAVISARFTHDKAVHIVPSLPANFFAYKTNKNKGANGVTRLLLEELGEGAEMGAAIPNGFYGMNGTKYASDGYFALEVPVGSIYCDNGNEFEFELTLDKTVAASYTMDVTVLAVSKEKEPFHFVKYDRDNSNNELYRNCLELNMLTMGLDGTKDVFVECSESQYDSNIDGLNVATLINSKIEDGATAYAEVFKAQAGVPQDVWVRVPGISEIDVFVERIEIPEKLFVNNQVKELEFHQSLVDDYMRKNPKQGMYLQMAGLIPTFD